MQINLNTLVSIPASTIAQEIGEETILLDTLGGRYFSLDPVGTRLWQLLRQYQAVRPTFDTLLAEFDVPSEKLEADLLALVQKMIDYGLVQVKMLGDE